MGADASVSRCYEDDRWRARAAFVLEMGLAKFRQSLMQYKIMEYNERDNAVNSNIFEYN